MCSAHDCNDTPASRPAVEVTVTARDRTTDAVRAIEIRTYDSAETVAQDIADVLVRRSGSDYVIVDADR